MSASKEIPASTPDGVERFLARIDCSGGDDSCWPWCLGTDKDGYGLFKFRGRTYRANRVALVWLGGKPLASEQVAMHWKCDNPPCCNPRHIRPGTDNDNNADRARKGRSSAGDAHFSRARPQLLARGHAVGTSKLTNDDVVAVLEMYKRGMSSREIARALCVAAINIRRLISGQSWAHHPAVQSCVVRMRPPARRKLSDDNVREIRSSGDSLRVLARRFGVSAGVVALARKGVTYANVI